MVRIGIVGFAFVLGLAVSAAVHATTTDSDAGVAELTDETFEHLTQISTGSTTGNWFVKFFAPWCGFCKSLAPVWDELAENLKESSVNVAKVDCTQNRQTCERFGVRGYPTLLFFHEGKVYKYKGNRDVTSLSAFALGGWEEETGETAPDKMSFFQEKLVDLDEFLSTIHLHDDPTTNAILLGLTLAGTIIVVMLVVFVVILFVCCPTQPSKPLSPQKEQNQPKKGDPKPKSDNQEKGSSTSSTAVAQSRSSNSGTRQRIRAGQ
eukprot:gene9302-1570_t